MSLDEWRLKRTFDIAALRDHLEGEEVAAFKQQVWDTLGKDPLFSDPNGELSLDGKRELAFKRMKRIVEYEFLTDEEIMQCPPKVNALVSALTAFDTGANIGLQLSREVGRCTMHFMDTINSQRPLPRLFSDQG